MKPVIKVFGTSTTGWKFVLIAPNGQHIAQSVLTYTSRAAAVNGADSVRKNAYDAEIEVP